jgi:hypothetical protein
MSSEGGGRVNEPGYNPMLPTCDASCAVSIGVGDHWCKPEPQCEVMYVGDWFQRVRCPRDAVKRITIIVGPLEHGTTVFEGAVCVEHGVVPESTSGDQLHVLQEPLEVANKPEMN